MAQVTLATARADLQNLVRAYQKQRRQFEEMRKNVDTLRSQTADNTALVQSTAVGILSNLGLQGAAFNAALGGILDEFGNTVLNIEGQGFSVNLALFLRYLQENSIEVKSRGTVFGGAVNGGSNVGTQVLVVCGTDRLGAVIESATIETLRLECLAQSPSRENLGLEVYQIKGDGSEIFNEFDSNGLQVRPSTLGAIGPGRSALLDNASFDLPFVGTGVSKIQGWTIVSGDSNIARDTTIFAQNRGGTPASLKITGNCKFRLDFRQRSKVLSPFVPYVGGLRLSTDADTSATIRIRVGTDPGAYTVTTTPGNLASAWTQLVLNSNSANAWLETFDTDGQPFFEIEVTGYAANNLYIDDAFFAPMTFVGGRPISIISGLTAAIRGDTHTQQCTLGVGTGSVELTGGASGSVDSITVEQPDGTTVELLSEAIPFDTSLAITAAAVAANINANVTYPQYRAAVLSGAIVTIYQIVPVEGTFAVVSTATTITTTDTDVTGASLGDIQDTVVRNTGAYLNHAASATAGWEDPSEFNGAM